MGADGRNRQVCKACEYVLNHGQASHGGFSLSDSLSRSWAVHCFNGNLVWSLVTLGFADDERLRSAVDWLAGSITGEDFDSYYASGVAGPGFRCGVNLKQPCAWGAVKALRALVSLPRVQQSAKIRRATDIAVEFLFSRDLAKADYPYTGRVSGEWFKFGFPLSYTSDILEALLAVAEAGRARDPRPKHALELVISKRDADGRWALTHTLNGKMVADVEVKGKPSKWVTLRALRVLKAVAAD